MAQKAKDKAEATQEAAETVEAAQEVSEQAPEESCQVCGQPAVFVQGGDGVGSKAAWCAQHLPRGLRAEAMANNAARQFDKEFVGLAQRREFLMGQTYEDLREQAGAADIEGRSAMGKDVLVEHLLRHELRQRRNQRP